MLPFSASQSGIQQHSSIMYHHSTIIENYEKRCIHDPGLTSHSFSPAARETKDQFKYTPRRFLVIYTTSPPQHEGWDCMSKR